MNNQPAPKTVISFLCVLAFGFIPLFLFLVWVERQCTLPWIPQWLGLPWIFVDGDDGAQAIWNLGLLLVGAAVQFLLARFRAAIPIRLCAGGISAALAMSLWQNTGRALYQLVPHAGFSAFLSLSIFWGMMGTVFKLAFRWSGPPEFLEAQMSRTVYLLTIGAIVISPMMTIDRIFVALVALFFPLFLR